MAVSAQEILKDFDHIIAASYYIGKLFIHSRLSDRKKLVGLSYHSMHWRRSEDERAGGCVAGGGAPLRKARKV